MAITSREAQQLCTKPELELVRQSSPRFGKDFTPAQIGQKVTRARKLRDKYRQLAAQQQREARGKGKPRGKSPASGHDRTARKAELFQETLDRLEAKLAKAQQQADAPAPKRRAVKQAKRATRAAAKKATHTAPQADTSDSDAKAPTTSAKQAVAKATARKKKAAKKKVASLGSLSIRTNIAGEQESLQKKSKKSKAQRKQVRFDIAGQTKIRGHVSSANRRSQAKRDRR